MSGVLFLQLIKRITKTDLRLPHFSIVCITGLSTITIIAGILSLFIPLGDWWVQLFFIAPCLFLLRKNSGQFFSSIKKGFLTLHIASCILLSACLLLILVMSTWTIVHPDTLGYHAQTIQWIEKYKAVPGLVHLHVRFGYQGLWFVDCALFGFSFTGKEGITFLNSSVLLWFFIFIINRINFNFFKEGNKIYGLLWTTLLLISMWSYTQVRLTATSASPDFIATLFILAIVYLVVEKNQKHLAASEWLLVSFLSLTAVTIKLAVGPVLLIAVVAALLFLIKRKIKLFFTIVILSIITLSPFIIRNIITSGYVVFPSTLIDVVNVDWKYSQEQTVNEKNYITSYAKKQGVSAIDEIDAVNNMSPGEWLPTWWQQRSIADKTIMILFIISLIAVLLSIKKLARSGFIPILILLTMLAGIIFWLINAPDPRFGFGSLIGFMAAMAYFILKEKEILIGKNVLISLLLICSATTFAYTGYRLLNFFNKDQLVTPLGIEKNEYHTFDCNGIKINSPIKSDFGITPIPCTDLDCEKFSPRGNKFEDGFKAK